MTIAILGTRGIPNNHGGFEQFAENFSSYASDLGHTVFVYNSGNHPYKKNSYKGVQLIHCYDPENKVGTIGQFIYDFNCIVDSRKRNFDIILQLGYTSSSIWSFLMPRKALIITNMDGLEWKRSKYNSVTKKFLKYAESLAVKYSDALIADSKGIKDYLKHTYNVHSKYIPYGADVFSNPDESILKAYNLKSQSYNLIIARIEPENNIEAVLTGFKNSNSRDKMIVVGNCEITKHGRYLKQKFKDHTNIVFLGSIYDDNLLNNLRYFSNFYFHGHMVGGTNPSLLEAMATSSLIIAHDNHFNKSILGSNAFYFKTSNDVSQLLNKLDKNHYSNYLENNKNNIERTFSWSRVNESYLNFFKDCLKKQRNI